MGKDKARDPEGYANEIFKEEVVGTDLLKAILKIMNLIKKKPKYPKVLEKCNITSIHKNKSKNDFENYRVSFEFKYLEVSWISSCIMTHTTLSIAASQTAMLAQENFEACETTYL